MTGLNVMIQLLIICLALTIAAKIFTHNNVRDERLFETADADYLSQFI